MHCVFVPNSQLCPLLRAQYPFTAPGFSPLMKSVWNQRLDLFWSLNWRAATMPRPLRAQSRRSWTTHWTTNAESSAWSWSGLQFMMTSCNRKTWPSFRSVQTFCYEREINRTAAEMFKLCRCIILTQHFAHLPSCRDVLALTNHHVSLRNLLFLHLMMPRGFQPLGISWQNWKEL